MNELRRMAYLEALGIDNYVSRGQLPGAAVTHRLAIAPRPREAAAVPARDAATAVPSVRELATPATRTRTERMPDPPPRSAPRPAAGPRFSLVTIVAGDWLWLEDLAGMPLATEQVQLVCAMARALQVSRDLRACLCGTEPRRPAV